MASDDLSGQSLATTSLIYTQQKFGQDGKAENSSLYEASANNQSQYQKHQAENQQRLTINNGIRNSQIDGDGGPLSFAPANK